MVVQIRSLVSLAAVISTVEGTGHYILRDDDQPVMTVAAFGDIPKKASSNLETGVKASEKSETETGVKASEKSETEIRVKESVKTESETGTTKTRDPNTPVDPDASETEMKNPWVLNRYKETFNISPNKFDNDHASYLTGEASIANPALAFSPIRISEDAFKPEFAPPEMTYADTIADGENLGGIRHRLDEINNAGKAEFDNMQRNQFLNSGPIISTPNGMGSNVGTVSGATTVDDNVNTDYQSDSSAAIANVEVGQGDKSRARINAGKNAKRPIVVGTYTDPSIRIIPDSTIGHPSKRHSTGAEDSMLHNAYTRQTIIHPDVSTPGDAIDGNPRTTEANSKNSRFLPDIDIGLKSKAEISLVKTKRNPMYGWSIKHGFRSHPTYMDTLLKRIPKIDLKGEDPKSYAHVKNAEMPLPVIHELTNVARVYGRKVIDDSESGEAWVNGVNIAKSLDQLLPPCESFTGSNGNKHQRGTSAHSNGGPPCRETYISGMGYVGEPTGKGSGVVFPATQALENDYPIDYFYKMKDGKAIRTNWNPGDAFPGDAKKKPAFTVGRTSEAVVSSAATATQTTNGSSTSNAQESGATSNAQESSDASYTTQIDPLLNMDTDATTNVRKTSANKGTDVSLTELDSDSDSDAEDSGPMTQDDVAQKDNPSVAHDAHVPHATVQRDAKKTKTDDAKARKPVLRRESDINVPTWYEQRSLVEKAKREAEELEEAEAQAAIASKKNPASGGSNFDFETETFKTKPEDFEKDSSSTPQLNLLDRQQEHKGPVEEWHKLQMAPDSADSGTGAKVKAESDSRQIERKTTAKNGTKVVAAKAGGETSVASNSNIESGKEQQFAIKEVAATIADSVLKMEHQKGKHHTQQEIDQKVAALDKKIEALRAEETQQQEALEKKENRVQEELEKKEEKLQRGQINRQMNLQKQLEQEAEEKRFKQEAEEKRAEEEAEEQRAEQKAKTTKHALVETNEGIQTIKEDIARKVASQVEKMEQEKEEKAKEKAMEKKATSDKMKSLEQKFETKKTEETLTLAAQLAALREQAKKDAELEKAQLEKETQLNVEKIKEETQKELLLTRAAAKKEREAAEEKVEEAEHTVKAAKDKEIRAQHAEEQAVLAKKKAGEIAAQWAQNRAQELTQTALEKIQAKEKTIAQAEAEAQAVLQAQEAAVQQAAIQQSAQKAQQQAALQVQQQAQQQAALQVQESAAIANIRTKEEEAERIAKEKDEELQKEKSEKEKAEQQVAELAKAAEIAKAQAVTAAFKNTYEAKTDALEKKLAETQALLSEQKSEREKASELERVQLEKEKADLELEREKAKREHEDMLAEVQRSKEELETKAKKEKAAEEIQTLVKQLEDAAAKTKEAAAVSAAVPASVPAAVAATLPAPVPSSAVQQPIEPVAPIGEKSISRSIASFNEVGQKISTATARIKGDFDEDREFDHGEIMKQLRKKAEEKQEAEEQAEADLELKQEDRRHHERMLRQAKLQERIEQDRKEEKKQAAAIEAAEKSLMEDTKEVADKKETADAATQDATDKKEKYDDPTKGFITGAAGAPSAAGKKSSDKSKVDDLLPIMEIVEVSDIPSGPGTAGGQRSPSQVDLIGPEGTAQGMLQAAATPGDSPSLFVTSDGSMQLIPGGTKALGPPEVMGLVDAPQDAQKQGMIPQQAGMIPVGIAPVSQQQQQGMVPIGVPQQGILPQGMIPVAAPQQGGVPQQAGMIQQGGVVPGGMIQQDVSPQGMIQQLIQTPGGLMPVQPAQDQFAAPPAGFIPIGYASVEGQQQPIDVIVDGQQQQQFVADGQQQQPQIIQVDTPAQQQFLGQQQQQQIPTMEQQTAPVQPPRLIRRARGAMYPSSFLQTGDKSFIHTANVRADGTVVSEGATADKADETLYSKKVEAATDEKQKAEFPKDLFDHTIVGGNSFMTEGSDVITHASRSKEMYGGQAPNPGNPPFQPGNEPPSFNKKSQAETYSETTVKKNFPVKKAGKYEMEQVQKIDAQQAAESFDVKQGNIEQPQNSTARSVPTGSILEGGIASGPMSPPDTVDAAIVNGGTWQTTGSKYMVRHVEVPALPPRAGNVPYLSRDEQTLGMSKHPAEAVAGMSYAAQDLLLGVPISKPVGWTLHQDDPNWIEEQRAKAQKANGHHELKEAIKNDRATSSATTGGSGATSSDATFSNATSSDILQAQAKGAQAPAAQAPRMAEAVHAPAARGQAAQTPETGQTQAVPAQPDQSQAQSVPAQAGQSQGGRTDSSERQPADTAKPDLLKAAPKHSDSPDKLKRNASPSKATSFLENTEAADSVPNQRLDRDFDFAIPGAFILNPDTDTDHKDEKKGESYFPPAWENPPYPGDTLHYYNDWKKPQYLGTKVISAVEDRVAPTSHLNDFEGHKHLKTNIGHYHTFTGGINSWGHPNPNHILGPATRWMDDEANNAVKWDPHSPQEYQRAWMLAHHAGKDYRDPAHFGYNALPHPFGNVHDHHWYGDPTPQDGYQGGAHYANANPYHGQAGDAEHYPDNMATYSHFADGGVNKRHFEDHGPAGGAYGSHLPGQAHRYDFLNQGEQHFGHGGYGHDHTQDNPYWAGPSYHIGTHPNPGSWNDVKVPHVGVRHYNSIGSPSGTDIGGGNGYYVPNGAYAPAAAAVPADANGDAPISGSPSKFDKHYDENGMSYKKPWTVQVKTHVQPQIVVNKPQVEQRDSAEAVVSTDGVVSDDNAVSSEGSVGNPKQQPLVNAPASTYRVWNEPRSAVRLENAQLQVTQLQAGRMIQQQEPANAQGIEQEVAQQRNENAAIPHADQKINEKLAAAKRAKDTVNEHTPAIDVQKTDANSTDYIPPYTGSSILDKTSDATVADKSVVSNTTSVVEQHQEQHQEQPAIIYQQVPIAPVQSAPVNPVVYAAQSVQPSRVTQPVQQQVVQPAQQKVVQPIVSTKATMGEVMPLNEIPLTDTAAHMSQQEQQLAPQERRTSLLRGTRDRNTPQQQPANSVEPQDINGNSMEQQQSVDAGAQERMETQEVGRHNAENEHHLRENAEVQENAGAAPPEKAQMPQTAEIPSHTQANAEMRAEEYADRDPNASEPDAEQDPDAIQLTTGRVNGWSGERYHLQPTEKIVHTIGSQDVGFHEAYFHPWRHIENIGEAVSHGEVPDLTDDWKKYTSPGFYDMIDDVPSTTYTPDDAMILRNRNRDRPEDLNDPATRIKYPAQIYRSNGYTSNEYASNGAYHEGGYYSNDDGGETSSYSGRNGYSHTGRSYGHPSNGYAAQPAPYPAHSYGAPVHGSHHRQEGSTSFIDKKDRKSEKLEGIFYGDPEVGSIANDAEDIAKDAVETLEAERQFDSGKPETVVTDGSPEGGHGDSKVQVAEVQGAEEGNAKYYPGSQHNGGYQPNEGSPNVQGVHRGYHGASDYQVMQRGSHGPSDDNWSHYMEPVQELPWNWQKTPDTRNLDEDAARAFWDPHRNTHPRGAMDENIQHSDDSYLKEEPHYNTEGLKQAADGTIYRGIDDNSYTWNSPAYLKGRYTKANIYGEAEHDLDPSREEYRQAGKMDFSKKVSLQEAEKSEPLKDSYWNDDYRTKSVYNMEIVPRDSQRARDQHGVAGNGTNTGTVSPPASTANVAAGVNPLANPADVNSPVASADDSLMERSDQDKGVYQSADSLSQSVESDYQQHAHQPHVKTVHKDSDTNEILANLIHQADKLSDKHGSDHYPHHSHDMYGKHSQYGKQTDGNGPQPLYYMYAPQPSQTPGQTVWNPRASQPVQQQRQPIVQQQPPIVSQQQLPVVQPPQAAASHHGQFVSQLTANAAATAGVPDQSTDGSTPDSGISRDVGNANLDGNGDGNPDSGNDHAGNQQGGGEEHHDEEHHEEEHHDEEHHGEEHHDEEHHDEEHHGEEHHDEEHHDEEHHGEEHHDEDHDHDHNDSKVDREADQIVQTYKDNEGQPKMTATDATAIETEERNEQRVDGESQNRVDKTAMFPPVIPSQRGDSEDSLHDASMTLLPCGSYAIAEPCGDGHPCIRAITPRIPCFGKNGKKTTLDMHNVVSDAVDASTAGSQQHTTGTAVAAAGASDANSPDSTSSGVKPVSQKSIKDSNQVKQSQKAGIFGNLQDPSDDTTASSSSIPRRAPLRLSTNSTTTTEKPLSEEETKKLIRQENFLIICAIGGVVLFLMAYLIYDSNVHSARRENRRASEAAARRGSEPFQGSGTPAGRADDHF